LELAIKGTIPSVGSVGGFENFLAPSIKDLQIVVGGMAGIFQTEDIVEAIVVWCKGIGKYLRVYKNKIHKDQYDYKLEQQNHGRLSVNI
jgi:hypothetical protein